MAGAKAQPNREWATFGKINPKPIKLTSTGIYDIYYHLLKVQLVLAARKAVLTGAGFALG